MRLRLLLALACGTALCLPTACGLPPIPVGKTSERYEFEIGRVALEAKRYLEAQTHLKRFLDSHPGHALADSAQFLLGQAHFKSRSYAEAAVEYSILVREFPRSELRDDAAYQECLCYFSQKRKPQLDATFALRARDCLNDFLIRYPDSPQGKEAVERLADLANWLAEKEYELGKTFTNMKRYAAGLIWFDEVLTQYPTSSYVPDALLWKARCQEKLGQAAEAEATYQRLLTDFPTHRAAEQARRTRPQPPADTAPATPR